MMEKKKDAMGEAIADYWKNGMADRLRVFSPMFEEDEIPVETLFRSLEDMPELEQIALKQAKGRTRDVGAGAGCHALALQEMGVEVSAIEISPLAAETMKERGVRSVIQEDVFEHKGKYDTILMLMNGIGIVGTLDKMKDFFALLNRIMLPGGQLLCDSSDIAYVFEDEEGVLEMPLTERYYGELQYRMQYKEVVGEPFDWLYIDAETLKEQAAQYGYRTEIIAEGPHYDYLAKITRNDGAARRL